MVRLPIARLKWAMIVTSGRVRLASVTVRLIKTKPFVVNRPLKM